MAIKYIQIAKQLKDFIIESNRNISYKLPTEAELCTRFSASRQTIRQALAILEKENYIYKKQGSGIYTIPLPTALASKKINILISDDCEYTNPSFISSLQKQLKEQHLTLNIFQTNWDFNQERQHLLSMLGENIYALYIEGNKTGFQNPNLDLYQQLENKGTKLILINSPKLPLNNATYINIDNYQGGYTLTKHLISLGRRKVACVMPDFIQEAKDRYAGFQAAFRDANLHIPDNNVYGYSVTDLQLLRNRRDTSFISSYINHGIWKYDCVICYNDEIAYWLIKELSIAKIAVPEQLSIASFDNSYLSTLGKISLSSMSLPPNEPAASAANILFNCLYEKETLDVLLHWDFVPRNSIQPL